MKVKTSEQDHINSLGDKWTHALAAASMSVRSDPKLVGLDKIRGPLATTAALKATGCPNNECFVVPRQAGPAVAGFQDIVDAAFAAAVVAATLKVGAPA